MTNQEELEKAQEDLQWAEYSRQVVDNPAYKRAMMIIRADVIEKFSKVSSKDVEDLQELNRRIHAADEFQRLLERTMEDGKVAEKKISVLTKAINKFRNK